MDCRWQRKIKSIVDIMLRSYPLVKASGRAVACDKKSLSAAAVEKIVAVNELRGLARFARRLAPGCRSIVMRPRHLAIVSGR